eukprot:COSAG01_NODE_2607_length_7390_cov_77.965574_4_plen_139_part_00
MQGDSRSSSGATRCPACPDVSISSVFRDKNRRAIGKSQAHWTDSKIETPGAQPAVVRPGGGDGDAHAVPVRVIARLHRHLLRLRAPHQYMSRAVGGTQSVMITMSLICAHHQYMSGKVGESQSVMITMSLICAPMGTM